METESWGSKLDFHKIDFKTDCYKRQKRAFRNDKEMIQIRGSVAYKHLCTLHRST